MRPFFGRKIEKYINSSHYNSFRLHWIHVSPCEIENSDPFGKTALTNTCFFPHYVAELIAYHLSQTKAFPIFFDTDDSSLSYNLSLQHLSSNNKNASDSLPDPNNIHVSMLKNLHPNSHSYFLSLYNSILHQSTHHLNWKLAFILLILKLTRDSLLSSSYQPIALTCGLGK